MAIASSTPANQPYPAVAFIGLGAMGFAMSTHLVRTGFPVTGYDIYGPTLDRWRATCKEIASTGTTTATFATATSPAEAVRHASVVCLMVANHHHVHSALFDTDGGAVHALPRDVTVIIHATIPPTQPSSVRDRLTREFGRADVKLIDAPVSGGVARSINGTLTIMVSSDEMENLQEPSAKAVLENVASKGKTLYPIPGGLGAGQSAKALNQVQCGIHIPAASEIMGLAAIHGLDTQKFYDALLPTPTTAAGGGKPPVGWSWMFENRGPRMLSATPPLASATLIINKDVGIIREEEVRLHVDLPLLNTASDVISEVMKTHATADDSCIVQSYLGFGSDREGLVVQQAGIAATGEGEHQQQHQQQQQQQQQASTTTKTTTTTSRDIATAHALIHLVSAYETIKFAQALDLMRPEQKKQWFSIIAGAAGGSTIFSEVIPRAFEDADGIEAAFKKYAHEKFPGALEMATEMIANAKNQGYMPVLLEAAVQNLKKLLL
ncbi:3-hydroxyisobutyrate dehydrogenase [Cladophialophora carrionii]|uniref:3-hydroxyisobutyrate dehydrogenase n=1 Tax=Cladophialophora carrionii TaxID=86049 RepID=A0A1C1CFL3_9EURO|nr:3-hydroxyisobutyrate dehydrogenase [Cladophialophora carrionii]